MMLASREKAHDDTSFPPRDSWCGDPDRGPVPHGDALARPITRSPPNGSANNCRDFVGTLTKIDGHNPDPYFFVDVKDASGKVESWSFQAYALVTLRRNGTTGSCSSTTSARRCVSGAAWRGTEANAAAAGTLRFTDGVLRQMGQIQD